MTQIEPVVFPLNLGVANQIDINISANADVIGGRIIFSLFDNTSSPIKRLSNGFFDLTEEEFNRIFKALNNIFSKYS